MYVIIRSQRYKINGNVGLLVSTATISNIEKYVSRNWGRSLTSLSHARKKWVLGIAPIKKSCLKTACACVCFFFSTDCFYCATWTFTCLNNSLLSSQILNCRTRPSPKISGLQVTRAFATSAYFTIVKTRKSRHFQDLVVVCCCFSLAIIRRSRSHWPHVHTCMYTT